MAKPTHLLKVKMKEGGTHCRVGVAWEDNNGWISIQLDPCVVLTDRDDIYINLYPIDDPHGTERESPDELLKSLSDEEVDKKKLLSEEEIKEALEQGKKERDIFEKNMGTLPGHYK